MVRYFGPDNGSAYVQLPNGRFAAGRVALVYGDEDGLAPADILGGTREVQGAPIGEVIVDSTGRLNFWFPDEQPVVWVSVNGGPLVRVTADLQDQLEDVDGGAGGGVTVGDLNAAIATHSADTTSVHGIADTNALETQSGAQTKANSAQSAATNAAALDATAKVTAHTNATDPHGDRAFATAALANKADLVGGVVPTAQIPAIAITEFLGSVANQAAMLALTGEKGDWAIRTDTGTTWVITGNSPATLGSWTEMPSAGAPVSSVNGYTGSVTLAKGDLGLGNVDNTADASKPVSTAQQAVLDGKQPLDGDLTAIAALDSSTSGALATDGSGWIRKSYAALKTALGLTKADVGLSAVDNTSDVGKPISTATQTALDSKQPLDGDLTTIAGLTATTNNFMVAVASAWASRTPAQAKTALSLTASDVGLGNVTNTSDANKPVSTAQQTALDAKADLVGGVVPTAQLPALAITEVFTAASQAAMLALTAQRGDVALRTDTGKTYILSTDSPSTLADWKEIAAIGVVQSVAGQTGVVVLSKTDVGLGSVVNALQLQAGNNLSDLANAATARTNLAVPPSTRAITAGTGLTGGGDLSADRTLTVAYGTSGTTAAAGNDSRITGAVQSSLVDAKGDLLAGTADNTIARVAVGANGTVLRAANGQTPGVEWANSNQTQTWSFTGTAVAATVGKTRWYNRTGRTLTVVGTWAAANTQPTGAAIVCDVNKNGTSFYGTATKPQVAASTNGGVLAAPDTGTTIADGDYITVDVDTVGSTIAGADVTVGVVYW